MVVCTACDATTRPMCDECNGLGSVEAMPPEPPDDGWPQRVGEVVNVWSLVQQHGFGDALLVLGQGRRVRLEPVCIEAMSIIDQELARLEHEHDVDRLVQARRSRGAKGVGRG